MEPEIDGVEKKPFLPFHPSCIVDSCQQPYPYCDSPFLSLTWVNGLNFHYDKHTGSRGWFYLVNWKMDALEKAVMSNRFTHSWAVIWSVIQNIEQRSEAFMCPHVLSQCWTWCNTYQHWTWPKPSRRLIQHTSASVSPYWVHTTKTLYTHISKGDVKPDERHSPTRQWGVHKLKIRIRGSCFSLQLH